MERKLLSILEYLLDFEFDYVNALNFERITIYQPEKNYSAISIIHDKTRQVFYIDYDDNSNHISYDELVELAREHRLIERLSETVLLEK